MVDRADLIERLQASGAKREKATEMRDQARRELRETVPEAVEAGIPIAHIAKHANMTRAALYVLLEELGLR